MSLGLWFKGWGIFSLLFHHKTIYGLAFIFWAITQTTDVLLDRFIISLRLRSLSPPLEIVLVAAETEFFTSPQLQLDAIFYKIAAFMALHLLA